MSNLLLPGDPDFDKPFVLGDAYNMNSDTNFITSEGKIWSQKAKLQKQRAENPSASNYAASAIAHAPDPWYKMAQMALMPKTAQMAGVDNMMAQPMWFSPLHTPQNWQIASKRREVYQWVYLPYSQLLMTDYTFQDMSEFIENVYTNEIIEDTLTGGIIYENIECSSIMGVTGDFRQPIRASERHCKEKICYSFSATGFWRKVSISEEHKIAILDGKSYRHRKRLLRERQSRRDQGVPKGGDKPECDLPEVKIIYKESRSVQADDFLVCPVSKCGNVTLSNERSWLLGQLLSDGHRSKQEHGCSVGFTINTHDAHKEYLAQILESEFPGKVRVTKHGDGDGIRISQSGKEEWMFFSDYVTGTHNRKKMRAKVFDLDQQSRLHLLGGFLDGDGSFTKKGHKLTANIYSQDMADQLFWILLSCGVRASLLKHRLTGDHYPTSSEFVYAINIPSSDVPILQPYMKSDKIPQDFVPKKSRALRFFYEENDIKYLIAPIGQIDRFVYTGVGYDVEVNPEKALLASGYAVSNCRFWYENEPKVAAAIDFYARFPMNGFDLECPDRKILSFFEHHIVKKLKLNERFKEISSEYYMLGDVFIHTDIECSICGGTAIDPDTEEECDHPGGKFSRVFVMNPDWIEVQRSPLTDEPLIVMIPDEELQQIVHKRQPKAIYDRIPEHLKPLIMAKAPIPLSNRTISHLRHMPVPYGTYGTSIIRRLFTTLAYKTKIMTANWIVAERLILPVRVVKIGSDDRPASTTDIADVQQQLAQTANDPNLTIVTHHNFDYEWYGTCHDERTEVLTSYGFKTYDQVDIKKDKIMCYNVYTKSLECIYATAKQEYDYDGELIHFDGEQLDIMVTPNHRMLVKPRSSNNWEVVFADKVVPGMRFLAHANYNSNTNFEPVLAIGDNIRVDMRRFFEYAGYYLSEGSMSCKKSNYQISISQSGDSPVLDHMISCLDELGMKYSDYNYSGRKVHSLTICNKQFVKFIKKEFGSHADNKSIPTWMKDAPTEYLQILIQALIDGDGQTIEHKNTINYVYTTISEQLSDDVQEIAFKLGFNVRKAIHTDSSKPLDSKSRLLFRTKLSKGKWSKGDEPRIKKYHIKRAQYKGKVWCFTTPTGFFVTRRNGKITIQGNSGKVLQITQEMEHIDKELLDGLMLNQALLNGEAPGYMSAQVGVETLIRRIEAWRSSLAEWCEENIFKPVAEMQGFIDEEKSEEVGETVFLYPTIKWNDLELKDNTQYHQMLMQLHDKQVISSQTLLDEMDLNYDQEVKRMRYEQAQLGPAGAALGQQGGMGGAGDMGGGGMGGGMPGGAESPEQGGMGGGMDMPGMGMGGAGDMGGGGGMGGGGMGAGTSGKITKKGKGGGEQDEEAIPMMPIKLTKIEQDMAVMLEELANNMGFNPGEFKMQFPVENPKGGKSFTMDFALPGLKMDIECLHPKTFLMTPDGMKIPQNIDIGSCLYDRNGNPTQVINKFCQTYDGITCEVRARGIIPFTITDTHKLLISKPNKTRIRRTEPTITRTREYIEPNSPEFTEAKDIKPGDYILFPKNPNESKDMISLKELNKRAKTTAKILPNDIQLDKDFGRFLGLYTSEGCASKSGSMWLCFGEHEKEYLDESEILLSELFNLSVNGRYTDNGSTRMSFCSVVLSNFLISNVGHRAPNKKVPDFMFYAPNECKEAYLRAMCDGDGCFRDGDCNHLRIQTSSDQLALGIQKLAATLGVWAPVAKSRDEGTYNIRGRTGKQNVLWDIAVNFNPRKKVYREDENYFYIRVRSITHEEYNGLVYNFTTEDHTYNIHNIVSKNCDGEVWHSSEEQESSDTERDYLLAQRGWTVLRFDDKSIEDSPQQVQATIDSYIKKSMEAGSSKQASKNGQNGKVTYFVGIDGRLKDFKSDGTKYYKYLDRVQP